MEMCSQRQYDGSLGQKAVELSELIQGGKDESYNAGGAQMCLQQLQLPANCAGVIL